MGTVRENGFTLHAGVALWEVKRRTRVVEVFPNETSASTLATEIALRSSEEWALRRYLTMEALEETEKTNPQLSRH